MPPYTPHVNRSSSNRTFSRLAREPRLRRTQMPTIYEQIGGAPAVEAAVDIFYRKVLTDDRVSRFFDDVDMDRQSAKQKAFLTMVFGGPASYTGQDMRRGHLHLIARGMNDDHVDAVIELLGETLTEL